MPLDFPSNPVDRQVSGNFYWDAASTAWRNVGSKNGLSTRVTTLESAAATYPSGLVPVIPTSVSVGSGSASVSSTGLMSFNSASSVTLNGVFSAAFKNYRIHMNIASYSVAGDYVFWRSVTGGSGVGGTYVTRGVANDGSSVGAWSANGSAGYMGRIAGDAALAYDLFDPFTTRRSRMVGQTHGYVSSENMFAISSMHDSLVSYNGIQMYMNSGLIEGTIQVYGYRN